MLATFGRVPMFYYVLHIPLIHALALVVWILRDGTAHMEWFATAPFVSIERRTDGDCRSCISSSRSR